MYLSLLTIPYKTESLKWSICDPYDVHRMLWLGHGRLEREATDNRFLYRHERERTGHTILVQTANEKAPDWTFLADEGAGITAITREYNLQGLENGDVLRFRLRANPVVTRQYDDGQRHRIAVGSDRMRMTERLRARKLLGPDEALPTRDEQLVEWMIRQGGRGGFRLTRRPDGSPICDPGPNIDYRIRNGKLEREYQRKLAEWKKQSRARGVRKPIRPGPMLFTGIDFEGVLQITDTETFRKTIRRGFGRGRGFGFGLLSVRKV